MFRFIVRRLLVTLPMVLVVITLTWALIPTVLPPPAGRLPIGPTASWPAIQPSAVAPSATGALSPPEKDEHAPKEPARAAVAAVNSSTRPRPARATCAQCSTTGAGISACCAARRKSI